MNAAGRLAGKRALVTGAGRGIGRALALPFATEEPASEGPRAKAAKARDRLPGDGARQVPGEAETPREYRPQAGGARPRRRFVRPIPKV